MNQDREDRIEEKPCKSCGERVLIQMGSWFSEKFSISCQECVKKTDDYDIVPCCKCHRPTFIGKSDFMCLVMMWIGSVPFVAKETETVQKEI